MMYMIPFRYFSIFINPDLSVKWDRTRVIFCMRPEVVSVLLSFRVWISMIFDSIIYNCLSFHMYSISDSVIFASNFTPFFVITG